MQTQMLKGRPIMDVMSDASAVNLKVLNQGNCVVYIPAENELESETWTIEKAICSPADDYLDYATIMLTTKPTKNVKSIFMIDFGNSLEQTVEQIANKSSPYSYLSGQTVREFTEEFSKTIRIDLGIKDRRNVSNLAIDAILRGTPVQQTALGYVGINLEIQSYL